MAVGDHFRLALSGGLAAQQIVSVFHYRQTTANTSVNSDVKALANAFELTVLPDMTNAQSIDVSYGTIESRTFPLPPNPLSGIDVPEAVVGDINIPALPPSVAVVIKRTTAFRGRAYRGRLFLPGIPNANVTDGIVTNGGYITLLNTLATTLSAAIVDVAAGSPTFVPEICTILNPGAPVLPTYRFNDVISCIVDLRLRSQRRREVGVGA